MQQNMTGVFSLPCSQPANVAAYLRMKIDGTYGLALAGASDREIGVLANTFVATGLGSSKYATLCGTNAGTAKYVANGAFALGAAVYAAANGEVAGSGTLFLGYALDAPTAAGDVIRVARDFLATGSVTTTGIINPTVGTLAATGTVSANQAAIVTQVVTVTASDGTKAVKLPAPASYGFVEIINTVANKALPVAPNVAETIDGAASLTILAGQRVMLFSDRTNWFSTAFSAGLPEFSASPAPAGSTYADAAAIASRIYLPASGGVDGTKGVKLPAPAVGLTVKVINTHATNALPVYANAAETIDGTAGHTGVSIAAKKTQVFVSDGTNWFSQLGA
jgi:hypothetical protein